MQTFNLNDDVTLKTFPRTPQEWATNPIIVFTIDKSRIVHKDDRIFCAQKMVTTGPKSGGIVDIYYYIDEVIDFKPNMIHHTNTDVTAKAIRREL